MVTRRTALEAELDRLEYFKGFGVKAGFKFTVVLLVHLAKLTSTYFMDL